MAPFLHYSPHNTTQFHPHNLFSSGSKAKKKKKKKKMANYSAQNSEPTTLHLHLCFFLLTLFMFLGFSWYLTYESILESLMEQLKLVLMVSPLLLLVVVHFLSYYGDGSFLSSLIPLTERESLHREGGTPWGVGLFLVVLLFMISYQSSLQERWFPLLTR